ncbi:hypothetical protein SAMN02745664_10773 [Moraxella cuniculi DSM 21768]|uniref:Uncharacterized protein n=1 Tax=Moraxella cuniculi DSM 21768 TaxID=1122245 RepID=A0A1N7ETX8_9GAMM|nr:hypothetical protein SAMN02745664_10773 [Moraxella cuniculi DSM 21768]
MALYSLRAIYNAFCKIPNKTLVDYQTIKPKNLENQARVLDK